MTNMTTIQQGKIVENTEVNELADLQSQLSKDGINHARISFGARSFGIRFFVTGIELRFYVFYDDVCEFLTEKPKYAHAIPVDLDQLTHVHLLEKASANRNELVVVQLVEETGKFSQSQLQRITYCLVDYFGGVMPPNNEATFSVRPTHPSHEVYGERKQRILAREGGYKAAFERIALS